MADYTASADRLRSEASQPDWVDKLARVGYATKGVVYIIIGVLAAQVAFGSGGQTTGSQGAIRQVAQGPFGQTLLILMTIGLAAYVIWQFVRSIMDAENEGTDGKGLVKRTGYLVSGIAYGALAFLAGRIAFGSGSSGSGGSSRQQLTAQLMSQPFGLWLVGIVGAIIVAVGLYHFYKAYSASFMDDYKTGAMSDKERRGAKRLGQWGLAARGVTFCIIGSFFIQAARQADPSEAQGLGAALSTLAQQPYGPWLLGVVALGLVAYGVFCFSKARYSYFDTN